MQATHLDLMCNGVQHMVALIFEGYCDTMSGTLQILINLTHPPKYVFPYAFFGIELQSDGKQCPSTDISSCGSVLDHILMMYDNRRSHTSPVCSRINKISRKP